MKGNHTWISLIIILVLVIGTGTYLYQRFKPKGINIDKDIYPVTGIDISNHTHITDWKLIKKAGIDFVYIKVSEGGDYKDPSYQKHARNALAAKIPYGGYHFFRFNRSGEIQAHNFLNTLLAEYQLPPVIDVEEWGNTQPESDYKETLEIKKFIREVETELSQKVIIYCNKNSYERFIEGNFPENPVWICTFSRKPPVPSWLFWQHSHIGRIPGIQSDVDINTFNGNREEWNKYFISILQ